MISKSLLSSSIISYPDVFFNFAITNLQQANQYSAEPVDPLPDVNPDIPSMSLFVIMHYWDDQYYQLMVTLRRSNDYTGYAYFKNDDTNNWLQCGPLEIINQPGQVSLDILSNFLIINSITINQKNAAVRDTDMPSFQMTRSDQKQLYVDILFDYTK